MEDHSIRFLLHGLVKLPYLGIFNYIYKSHTLLMFIIIPNYTSTKIIPLVIFDTKITQIRIKFLTRHKLTHFSKQTMKL